jgi:undecaprenyl-diphosphatase
MLNFNTQLLEFINNASGQYHLLDSIFIVATSYVTLVVIGIAVLYYFFVYLPWREEGMARVVAFRNAWNIAWAVFLTWMVVSLIKVLVAFPRPFQTIKNLHVLISLPSSYSFPSGHAAVTMALATAVYFYRKRLGELLFVYAFVVGMARVYVGVHYPLDVGAGFLIGYLIPKLLHVYRHRVK